MIDRELIEFLRHELIEHLFVYKKGKKILHFKGNEDFVEVPKSILFRFKDATILHNHTASSSFSEADVVEAIENDVFQFILVTKEYIYKLTRPKNGWNVNFKDIETLQFYERCKILARTSIENEKSKNELRYDEENLFFNHYIWLIFFSKYEISYEKKSI